MEKSSPKLLGNQDAINVQLDKGGSVAISTSSTKTHYYDKEIAPSRTSSSIHEGPNMHSNEKLAKPRKSIAKKDRKPSIKPVAPKPLPPSPPPMVEPPPPPPPQKRDMKPAEPPVEQPQPTLSQPPKAPVIPELPKVEKSDSKTKVREEPQRKKRSPNTLISSMKTKATPADARKVDPTKAMWFGMQIQEQMRMGIGASPHPVTQNWQKSRLALSQAACRFELPMDMKQLEQMSPMDYLRHYCILTTRRETLYRRIFDRYKNRNGELGVRELEKALTDTLVQMITEKDIRAIKQLIALEDNQAVEFNLFAGLAAMAERMLYPRFRSEEIEFQTEVKKELLEKADFSALDWKLSGITVSNRIRDLLNTLIEDERMPTPGQFRN